MKSKSDAWLLIASVVGLAIAVLVYYRNHLSGSSDLSLLDTRLQVVGVIHEHDCIQCLEKLLCNWHTFEKDIPGNEAVFRLLFTNLEPTFNVNELEHLCSLPKTIEFISEAEYDKSSLRPLVSPSVMITNGESILFMEPIFYDTNMLELLHKVKLILTNYRSATSPSGVSGKI